MVSSRMSRRVALVRFLQDPHGVTSQKTPFFIVTAVKTSNLAKVSFIINYKHACSLKGPSLEVHFSLRLKYSHKRLILLLPYHKSYIFSKMMLHTTYLYIIVIELVICRTCYMQSVIPKKKPFLRYTPQTALVWKNKTTAPVVYWSEFQAANSEVPGSIPGATRFSA
jgi:hypothetical protein